MKLEGAAAAFLLLCFAVTVFARSVDPNAFNYDVAYVLYVAEQILDGKLLYREVIDENPPMIFWLSSLPVAMARAVGATPILVFNTLVLLLSGVACAFIGRILRQGWPDSRDSYRLALLCCFATVAIVYPGFDYGQRENLFFILVSAYVFAAASTARGRPLSSRLGYGVGLMAGIGFAIKPFYVLVWLAIEIWLQLRHPGRRAWRRPENQMIVAIQILYAAACLLFASEYLEIAMVAMVALSPYGSFGDPRLLLHPATLIIVIGGLSSWLLRDAPADRELRSVWLLASLGGLAMAIIQSKGWGYHYFPAAAGGLMLLSLLGLGLVERHEELARVLRPPATVLPLVAILVLGGAAAFAATREGLAAWGPSNQRPTVIKELVRLVEEHAWRRPIYVMSSSVSPAFPLVNLTDAQWSSRFCCIWWVQAAYSREELSAQPFPYHGPEDMTDLERLQIDAVVADLTALPPALLIVDQSRNKQAFGVTDFDYLTFFRRDARFAAIFSNYREFTRVGSYRVYLERGPGG